MSSSYTPKYTVLAYYVNGKGDPRCRDELPWSGKPSQKKLDEMRDVYNKSYAPGGCNSTLSKSLGYCTHYYKLQLIRNNSTRDVALESNAPAFEVA